MPAPNRLLQAAWELHQFFTEREIPYAIIGGMAVQHWGEPRVTLDIDLTVMFPHGIAEFVALVSTRFQIRSADPVDFARQTRVVLIQTANAVAVDISLGVPGYEDQVMQRAAEYEIARGKRIRLCSAEDLIIHKAVAGRDKDLADLTRIVQKQSDKLDAAYIRHWLGIFADLLANDEIVARFERAWRAEKRAAREARQVYRTRRS
ncbi:MAG: nucleotidyltransferase [Anaerolineales bacterium]|nr:nucleotidyltransferase [Anaerolineales bacterium]